MFDIGFWELFLIAVIALVVLGPERMPAAVRSLGKTIGHWRRVAGRLHREFMDEIEASDLKEIKEVVSSANEIKSEFLTSTNSLKDSVNQEINDAEKSVKSIERDFSEDTGAEKKKVDAKKSDKKGVTKKAGNTKEKVTKTKTTSQNAKKNNPTSKAKPSTTKSKKQDK